MSDSNKFSEEFLRRCESSEVDDDFLKELVALNTEERSELARILLERKIRRGRKNGGVSPNIEGPAIAFAF